MDIKSKKTKLHKEELSNLSPRNDLLKLNNRNQEH